MLVVSLTLRFIMNTVIPGHYLYRFLRAVGVVCTETLHEQGLFALSGLCHSSSNTSVAWKPFVLLRYLFRFFYFFLPNPTESLDVK